MIQQTDRMNYWKVVSESHMLVAHNADIMQGGEVVDQRKSFVEAIQDELEASEIIKLHFPCVVAYLVPGKIVIKDGQRRFRYLNQLSFLHRFSVDSDIDPSIPKSKRNAFNVAYNVMMDFVKKLLNDYEIEEACGYFRYLDDNNIHWDPVELAGSNMCGWDLFFPDEEPLNFDLASGEPLPGWQDPDTEPDTENANEKEIIYFGNESEVVIPWTDERKSRFGMMPTIQVWKFVGGLAELFTAVTIADDTPEELTHVTVNAPGTPGFIVIS